MSFENLVGELEAAVRASPRRPIEPTRGRTADISPSAVAGLTEALQAEPGLKGIWGKILVLPGQSSSISPTGAALNLTERVRSGARALEVIESLMEFARTGLVHYASVRAVSGFTVFGRVDIGDGAYLDLPDTLPPGVARNVAFHIGIGSGAVPPGDVALVIETTFPALAEPPPPTPPGGVPQPFFSGLERRQSMMDLQARAHLALVAGGGVAPRYGGSYGFFRNPGLPISDELGVGGSWAVPPPPPVLDGARSAAMLAVWTAPGETPPVINRAARHLQRSRSREEDEERAIDLGACLEMLLMRNDSGGNTEITNKISHRGAWLLGRDSGDRAQTFKTIREIYALRSKAVHEGQLKPLPTMEKANERRQIFAAGEAICERLIIRLMAGWPDWNQLTLQLNEAEKF